ncbi:hypothetical protein ACFWNN_37090 [Lentzea sp. NPDC058450]|uniref:hypothetical protein n=1 Tax=Lentzea sp. NPDC058450 TaxID=3346505 RepID=UPI0036525A9B
MLIELLKQGYAVPVLLAVFALLTRHVWVELARAFRDWVRSGHDRRRAGLEKKVVDHALKSETEDEREHSVELLRLLLNAPGHSLPETPPPETPPPDDPPPEEKSY